MRNLLCVVVVLISACLEPSMEPVDGGGQVVAMDAGPQQCSVDGRSCWAPQTYCEAAPCTYQFPETGGTCDGQRISPSCFCDRDEHGAFQIRCTGSCPPSEDGGFTLLCLTPGCGNVNCGPRTRCTAYGVCE